MTNPIMAAKHQPKCMLEVSGTDQGAHHIPSLLAQEFKPRVNSPEAFLQHPHPSCSPRTCSP